jgi:hypothetical protein
MTRGVCACKAGEGQVTPRPPRCGRRTGIVLVPMALWAGPGSVWTPRPVPERVKGSGHAAHEYHRIRKWNFCHDDPGFMLDWYREVGHFDMARTTLRT